MTTNRFCRYELRTTDVDAAHDFYRELLGDTFWPAGIALAPLPAAAAARGAPPHWLGHIGVDDVVGRTYRFVDAGARLLGPEPRGAQAATAVLRDPFGAIVALSRTNGFVPQERVAWHLHSSRDEEAASRVYSDLFGWTLLDRFDLGQRRGRHVTFTWETSGRSVGSVSDIARLPHVHAQWLFFMHTDNLDESCGIVRDMGGLVQPTAETADGDLVAACDDPQGAAFGLYQRRRP